MSLELTKNGAIQGWVVATSFTLMTMLLLFLGFFVESVKTGWEDFGTTYRSIYIGSLVIWLGYKGVKGAVEVIQNAKTKRVELNNK